MRIVFMGTPDFAVPSLAALLRGGHEVCAAYTQPDKPQGRKQVLTPPPVKTLAAENGIPVFQPQTLKDEAEQERLRQLAPDVIVVAAYGKILPKAVLDIPEFGCVNVHGSLLPRWRGAAPIQWSVIAGDSVTGVTTMRMAEGLDTGDILLSWETPIGARETAGELFGRLAEAGAELLLETLERIKDITPSPQDDSKSTYAHMLDKKMAVIDWAKPAREIDCLVRGLNPWPVAITEIDGKRLKVFSVSVCEGAGRPGEVIAAGKETGLLVSCGEGAVRLEEVQLTGGKRMNCSDFLRGHPVAAGAVLG